MEFTNIEKLMGQVLIRSIDLVRFYISTVENNCLVCINNGIVLGGRLAGKALASIFGAVGRVPQTLSGWKQRKGVEINSRSNLSIFICMLLIKGSIFRYFHQR